MWTFTYIHQSGDVDPHRLQWVEVPVSSSVIVEVSSEWFQVCGMGFFDESELSQVWLGQNRRFPPWRLRTGSAVLGVSKGGNRLGGPQAVTTCRENTSGTSRTTADNYFWFAAASGKWSGWTCLASDRPNPSSKHVADSRTSHNPVG